MGAGSLRVDRLSFFLLKRDSDLSQEKLGSFLSSHGKYLARFKVNLSLPCASECAWHLFRSSGSSRFHLESGPRLGGAAVLYSAGGVRLHGWDRNPLSPLTSLTGGPQQHVPSP